MECPSNVSPLCSCLNGKVIPFPDSYEWPDGSFKVFRIQSVFDPSQLTILSTVLLYIVIGESTLLLFDFFLRHILIFASFRRVWRSFQNFREHLRIRYISSFVSTFVEVGMMVLSLCSVILFMLISFRIEEAQCQAEARDILNDPVAFTIEFFFSFFFFAYWIFRLLITGSPMKFIIHPIRLADLLCIIAGWTGAGVGSYLWFFQNLRFLGIYRSVLFLLKKYEGGGGDSRGEAVALYMLGVVSYIFCSAGFMFTVENSQLVGGQISNVMDSVYFIVITITTVGYGDIIPVTTIGRSMIMVIIVGALIYIPVSTTNLISVLSRSKKSVAFRSKYVIVSVSDNEIDPSDFIEQFFVSDEREATKTTSSTSSLAIVVKGDLHPNCRQLIRLPKYHYRVVVVQGDLSLAADARRADVRHADCIFLLAKRQPGVVDDVVDTKTILTSTFLQSLLSSPSSSSTTTSSSPSSFFPSSSFSSSIPSPADRIFIQVLLPKNQLGARVRGLKYVVNERRIRMGLIAQSCLHPGFATLVSNLIVTSSDPIVPVPEFPVMSAYNNGLAQEFFTDFDVGDFAGRVFLELSIYFSKRFQILFFGITRNSRVMLNPHSCVIKKGDRGIFVSSSYESVKKSLCSIPSDDTFQAFVNVNFAGESSIGSTFNGFYSKLRSAQPPVRESGLGGGNDGGGDGGDGINDGGGGVGDEQPLSDDEMVMDVLVEEPSSSSSPPPPPPPPDNLPTKDVGDGSGRSIGSGGGSGGGSSGGMSGDKGIGGGGGGGGISGGILRHQHARKNGSPSKLKNEPLPSVKFSQRVDELAKKRQVNNSLYFLNDFPVSLRSSILSKYTSEGHIVICTGAVTQELFALIRPLRSRALSHHEFGVKDIVFLTHSRPADSVWKRLGIFTRVFVIVGDTTSVSSLQAAGVRDAAHCILLYADDGEKGCRKSSVVRTDARTLSSYALVKALTRESKCNVVMSMCEAENVSLLNDTLMGAPPLAPEDFSSEEQFGKGLSVFGGDEFHNAYYVSGEVFLPQVLDSLLCQTFFNSSLIDVVHQLLLPQTIYSFTCRKKQYAGFLPGKTTFADLHQSLATNRRRLPFAVLRYRGSQRVLIAAPPSSFLIEADDRIFCLMQHRRANTAEEDRPTSSEDKEEEEQDEEEEWSETESASSWTMKVITEDSGESLRGVVFSEKTFGASEEEKRKEEDVEEKATPAQEAQAQEEGREESEG